jgi:hypothetical protein
VDTQGVTKRAETLPFPDPTTSRATGDVITARVLRRCLLPGFDRDEVARELACLAHHRRRPLNQAMARIERARTGRPSIVVERAQSALVAAVHLVGENHHSAAA